MAPLAGNLESVYSLYNLNRNDKDVSASKTDASTEQHENQQPIRRDIANPKFTNYSYDF